MGKRGGGEAKERVMVLGRLPPKNIGAMTCQLHAERTVFQRPLSLQVLLLNWSHLGLHFYV